MKWSGPEKCWCEIRSVRDECKTRALNHFYYSIEILRFHDGKPRSLRGDIPLRQTLQSQLEPLSQQNVFQSIQADDLCSVLLVHHTRQ